MFGIQFYICCINFIRIGEQIRDVTWRGDVIIENFIENDRVIEKIKYKINHEGWNIILEHIVLWLDEFIASKPPNNTQNMHIIIFTFASPVKCVFEPSKENKSKTINARKKKTRTVLESASNSAQNFVSRFSIFVLFFFFLWLKIFK